MAIPEYGKKPISFRLPVELQIVIDEWIRSDEKKRSVIYREIMAAGLAAMGKISKNGNSRINNR
jgi:hypothetical protein